MEIDVLELSSDSDPDATVNYSNADTDIDALISKYQSVETNANKLELKSDLERNATPTSPDLKKSNNPTTTITFEPLPSTSFSNVNVEHDNVNFHRNTHNWNSVSTSNSSSSEAEDNNKGVDQEIEDIQNIDFKFGKHSTKEQNWKVELSSKSKTRNVNSEKEMKKKETEAKKLQRMLEREQKKQEMEREKALKRAMKAANKKLKPEECLKVF